MKAAPSGALLRAFLLVALLAAAAGVAHRARANDAQGNPTVLRDTEIETDITDAGAADLARRRARSRAMSASI